MGMTRQHFHIPYILCHFALCLFMSTGRWWNVLAWVVLMGVWCMLMCMESKVYVLWVAATQLLLSMVRSVLYAEAVECTSSAESVWHVRVYVM